MFVDRIRLLALYELWLKADHSDATISFLKVVNQIPGYQSGLIVGRRVKVSHIILIGEMLGKTNCRRPKSLFLAQG